MKIMTYKSYINDLNQNYLVNESTTYYSAFNSLDSPEKIYEIMRDVFHMHQLAEELAYLICLNSKCVPSAFFMLSKGTVNTTLISTREIFIQSLLSSAVRIILCHNHPSQVVTPSQMDKDITQKIKAAGELLDIPLIDHIIIGRDSFFSFSEQGLL